MTLGYFVAILFILYPPKKVRSLFAGERKIAFTYAEVAKLIKAFAVFDYCVFSHNSYIAYALLDIRDTSAALAKTAS